MRDGNLEDFFRLKTKHGVQHSPMEYDYDLVPRVTF